MLPARVLTGKTPYEALKGKKPNLQHVKIFGYIAYMKITGVHTKKLDDRSRAVVYLESEPGTKAHRLYDPKNDSVLVSRDVVFEESKSWPWKLHLKDNECAHNSFVLLETTSSNLKDAEMGENTRRENAGLTPIHHSHSTGNFGTGSIGSSSEDESSEFDSGPVRLRLFDDIYNEAPEIELDDDELMLLAIDESTTYKQAIKENEWKLAMKAEIDSIEKNKT